MENKEVSQEIIDNLRVDAPDEGSQQDDHQEAASTEQAVGDNEPENENEQRDQDVDDDLEIKWQAQKKRLAKIQREKHRIAAEAQKLREENDHLRSFNQTSNQVSQTHYENSLKLKLDQAKEAKKKALELNDIDGVIEADSELYSTVADIKALDNWKAQEMIRQYEAEHYRAPAQQQRSNYEESAVEINAEAERWIRSNPWFDPNSPYYDPDKAEEVQTYAEALDASLEKRGRQNEYFSKGYFDKINNFVRGINEERNVMREERQSNVAHVAPVKRGPAPGSPQSQRVKLSDVEKLMARNAGVTEEQWIKEKIRDQKVQREKREYSPY